MKTTKTYTRLLVLALFPLLLSGCLNDLFEQDDRTYQGDDVVEFFPLTESVTDGMVLVENAEGDLEEEYQAGATVDVTTEIQLITPQGQLDRDIQVGYTVDAENTTAVEGTHYTIETPSPVTIPANTSQATVEITVLDSDLTADDDPVQLVLNLTGSEDGSVAAAENLDTFTLTINGNS